MIKAIKINKFAVFMFIILILYFVLVGINQAKTTNANSYKTPFILIDAGHGGSDGGAVGTTTNVKESDLNLQYAKTLKKYFLSLNYRVELVRETEFSLKSNKKDDMEERRKIIEKSKADIFISIHMNKFSDTVSKGSQVFYKQDDEPSKNLAENIKNLLVKNIEHSRKLILSGDFLVLNSAKCPSVLIECGFLSNAQDEQRLQTEEYREALCYQIFCGTLKFLSNQ